MGNSIINFLIIWNIIVFVMYGVDKYKAITNRWRISEKALIVSAFCMGAVGAMLGMEIFRHKTKKKIFRTLVSFALILNIAVYMNIIK